MSSAMFLDYGDGDGMAISSTCDVGDIVLARLSRIIDVPVQEKIDRPAIVEITAGPSAEEANIVSCRFMRCYARRSHFQLSVETTNYGKHAFSNMCRVMTVFGQAYAISTGASVDSCFVHGAMLENGNECIILVGQSGIGKSTTLRRYVKAGGIGCADDMILLHWHDGEFYANPLPTWSKVVTEYDAKTYPFRHRMRVRGIFMLDRGKEREYVARIAEEQYRLSLAYACAETSISIANYPAMATLYSKILDHIVRFSQIMCRAYPPVAFFANPDCNINDTMTELWS